MALSHIREGAELLAHRIHGAKNLYLNGLQRYHDPKWCQMPLDLYSKAMWILRIILAAILRRLLVSAAKLTLDSGIVLPSPRTSFGPRLPNHAGTIVSLKAFGAWRHAIEN